MTNSKIKNTSKLKSQEDSPNEDTNKSSFLSYLVNNFKKKSFDFFIIIALINFISLLIKLSIGLYGYSGKLFIIKYSI